VVFDAPVRVDDHDVRAGCLRRPDVGDHLVADQARAAHRGCPGPVPGGDRVAPQDRDLHAADREDRRGAGRSRVSAGTAVTDPQPVESGDRLEDALRARVTDVIVGQAHPVEARPVHAREQSLVEGEYRPRRVVARVDRRRSFVVREREVGPGHDLADGPRVAEAPGERDRPAEARAAAVPRDRGPAAAEREVNAAAPEDRLSVDAAVEHDVARGGHSPQARRRERVGGSREASGQRPGGNRRDPIHAEQRATPPGESPDGGPDGIGAQEPEAAAVRGKGRGQGAGVRDQRQARPRRLGKPERGQDRRRLGADEQEAAEPARGPREGRGGIGGEHILERRPELDDRNDRDVGQARCR